MNVAIIGATGFLGTAVVEELTATGIPHRAIARSSGNAWRLLARGIPIHFADLLVPAQIDEALADCTHVINCSYGNEATMRAGLDNLLEVCRRRGIERFVHISSVAIYGARPPRDSITEAAAPSPESGGKGVLQAYGVLKLEQDHRVLAAHAAGLPSVILCPPNIVGPYSPYLDKVVQVLAKGMLPLVDGGRYPVNVVDVRNLAVACATALTSPAVGDRYFVTEDEGVTWRDFIDELMPLFEVAPQVEEVSEGDFLNVVDANTEQPASLARTMKHLVSRPVRQALLVDPLLARSYCWMRSALSYVAPVETRLREELVEPRRVQPIAPTKSWDIDLARQQLRKVPHSCARARRELGYQPRFSFRESMADYRAWKHAISSTDRGPLRLLRELA